MVIPPSNNIAVFKNAISGRILGEHRLDQAPEWSYFIRYYTRTLSSYVILHEENGMYSVWQQTRSPVGVWVRTPNFGVHVSHGLLSIYRHKHKAYRTNYQEQPELVTAGFFLPRKRSAVFAFFDRLDEIGVDIPYEIKQEVIDTPIPKPEPIQCVKYATHKSN